MGGGERRRDLTENGLGRLEIQWTVGGEPLGHRRPVDILHDEIRNAVGQLADAVHGDDVGMRDGRDGLGFALEARGRIRRRRAGDSTLTATSRFSAGSRAR